MEGTRDVSAEESGRALAESRAALESALQGRGLDDPEPDALLLVRAREVKRTAERKTRQAWSAVAFVVGIVAVVVAAAALSSRGKQRPPAPGRAVAPAPPPGGRGPGPYAPRLYPAPPPPFGLELGFAVQIPALSPPPPPEALPMEEVLASRGWFDGDAVELTLELTDARTGELRWWRTVRDDVDPASPEAMARLLDRALAGAPLDAGARARTVENGAEKG